MILLLIFLLISCILLLMINLPLLDNLLNIQKRLYKILRQGFLSQWLLELEFSIKCSRLHIHFALLFVLGFLSWFCCRDRIYYCIFGFAPISDEVLVDFLYEYSMGCVFAFVYHFVGALSGKL